MSLSKNHNILGNILKIYRERQRLSVNDIAHRCDVEVAEVEAWENGNKEPNHYFKLLLSTIYSVPITILINNFEENIEQSFCFRAVSGEQVFPEPYMYIFAGKAASIRDFLRLVNEKLSTNNKHPMLEKNTFLGLDSDEDVHHLSNINTIDDKAKDIIKKISNKFVEYYNLSNGPKTDLLNILPSKSATVIYTPVPDGYNGISFLSDDEHDFYIFVNSQDHYCKQVFTLVHEIGHVIFIKVNNLLLIEDIINYFVNITLLPSQDMEELFASFNVDNFSKFIQLFDYVSKTYEVSYKTILYSLYHLGKLNTNDIINTVEQLMFQYFTEDSAVKKIPYRHNKIIHTYLKELSEKGFIDNSYIKEINTIAPLIA